MRSRHPGWPVRLQYGQIGLRPMLLRDAVAWSELRLRNEEWLRPWEPSSLRSWQERHSLHAYLSFFRELRKTARTGATLPWGITYEGRFVGQLTVANIVHGALHSGQVGYWIDRSTAGQGVMTAALALASDHCFLAAGLHRLQVDIRPENSASRRVVEKLGFRQEAYFVRYLDIDGIWQDHIGYAMTKEECPDGLINRLPSLSGEP